MAASVETPAENSGEDRPREQRSPSRLRLGLVNVLIWLTAVLLLVGVFAVWANRQILNPDNWSKTSTQLLQKQSIRSAAANYAVDQLYANVDVAALLRRGLPNTLRPLAGPASGALRNAAVSATESALSLPIIQNAWAAANRGAAQQLVAIVNGGRGPARVNRGEVRLDLAPIVDDLAPRLGLPRGLGSRLPPSIATFTVFKSDQLRFVQDVLRALRGLALALEIAVPVLFVLALALVPGRRRRTLTTIGFAIVAAGVLTFLARRIFVHQVSSSLVSDASLAPAVRDASDVATEMLSEIAGATVLIGVVLVFAAWFAGPMRSMTAARRAITPFLRDHPDRAAGVTAVILAIVFLWQPIPATGTLPGILVITVLAFLGVALLRRQAIEEFPDAREGETVAALRAWAERLRGRRHQPPPLN